MQKAKKKLQGRMGKNCKINLKVHTLELVGHRFKKKRTRWPQNREGEPTHTEQAYTGPASGNRRGGPGGQQRGTDYQTRPTEHDTRRKAHLLDALHGHQLGCRAPAASPATASLIPAMACSQVQWPDRPAPRPSLAERSQLLSKMQSAE
jgi:hypothetical protein